MDQEEITNANRTAWEFQSYEAWVSAYGTPNLAAAELVRDPSLKLRRIMPYLNSPKGEKIANPLGSHGRVAVSLALLGAEVTVFDISATNKRYAVELAESAGVSIEYKVGDFINLADQQYDQFDRVVIELGVVHLNDQEIPTCLVRRWNLGEIVTAFAENGFRLNKLVEEPSRDIAQLPGTFTLVANVE